jgi:hypothetical protein
MYKVKLFKGTNTDALQHTINEWLQMNKDILIHSSNLADSNGENLGSNEYVFFILYAGTDTNGDELKEMAATVTQEQSVEVKEINPQIMEPSS